MKVWSLLSPLSLPPLRCQRFFEKDFKKIPQIPCSEKNILQIPCSEKDSTDPMFWKKIPLIPCSEKRFHRSHVLKKDSTDPMFWKRFHRSHVLKKIPLIPCSEKDSTDPMFWKRFYWSHVLKKIPLIPCSEKDSTHPMFWKKIPQIPCSEKKIPQIPCSEKKIPQIPCSKKIKETTNQCFLSFCLSLSLYLFSHSFPIAQMFKLFLNVLAQDLMLFRLVVICTVQCTDVTSTPNPCRKMLPQVLSLC